MDDFLHKEKVMFVHHRHQCTLEVALSVGQVQWIVKLKVAWIQGLVFQTMQNFGHDYIYQLIKVHFPKMYSITCTKTHRDFTTLEVDRMI